MATGESNGDAWEPKNRFIFWTQSHRYRTLRFVRVTLGSRRWVSLWGVVGLFFGIVVAAIPSALLFAIRIGGREAVPLNFGFYQTEIHSTLLGGILVVAITARWVMRAVLSQAKLVRRENRE